MARKLLKEVFQVFLKRTGTDPYENVLVKKAFQSSRLNSRQSKFPKGQQPYPVHKVMLYGLAYSGFGRRLRCCPLSRLSRLMMYVGVVFGNEPCHVTQVALSSFCLPGLFNLSMEHRRYVIR